MRTPFSWIRTLAAVALLATGALALSAPVAHADWHGGWRGGGGWGWRGGGWGCCWRGGVFVGVAPPVYYPPPVYYAPPPVYYPPPYYYGYPGY
jgi:hypothetical protein